MYIKYLQIFLLKQAKNHSKGTTYVIEIVTFTNKRGHRLVAGITGLEKGDIRPVVLFAH